MSSFTSIDQVANTSFVVAARFALKPCASNLLHSTANAAGNLAWYVKSMGWQAQTALIYAAFSATLVSAAICAATKHGTQTDSKKIAFKIAAGVGVATCAVALSVLYKEIKDIQTWAPSWDSQYPGANISFIAQQAPFYC